MSLAQDSVRSQSFIWLLIEQLYYPEMTGVSQIYLVKMLQRRGFDEITNCYLCILFLRSVRSEESASTYKCGYVRDRNTRSIFREI